AAAGTAQTMAAASDTRRRHDLRCIRGPEPFQVINRDVGSRLRTPRPARRVPEKDEIRVAKSASVAEFPPAAPGLKISARKPPPSFRSIFIIAADSATRQAPGCGAPAPLVLENRLSRQRGRRGTR